MNKTIKNKKGFYYTNDVWFSPAYQSLSNATRDLLQCMLTEFRRKHVKPPKSNRFSYEWIVTNNNEISFTEVDFKKLTGKCSSTYLKARNKLIEVGFIKLIYRGGFGIGDRAKYRIFVGTNLKANKERWRRYPDKSWAHEIPKPKEQLVGVKTQWKKGQSGRKTKATLQD
jgi:hypothetical protein